MYTGVTIDGKTVKGELEYHGLISQALKSQSKSLRRKQRKANGKNLHSRKPER